MNVTRTHAFAGMLALAGALTFLTPATAVAQDAPPPADVNVVNVPTVTVTGMTEVVFQAVDMPFGAGETVLAEVDVSRFRQVRVAMRARSFGFPVTVTVVEGDVEVLKLDSFTVQPCPSSPSNCVSPYTTTRLYEVPGRTLRISALGASKADLVIFGR